MMWSLIGGWGGQKLEKFYKKGSCEKFQIMTISEVLMLGLECNVFRGWCVCVCVCVCL